jgi:hypothetical protein
VLRIYAAPGRDTPQSNSPFLTFQSFRADLQRVQNALLANPNAPEEIGALEASVPASWSVETADSRYEVSSGPVRSLLEAARTRTSQRAEFIRQAAQWINELTSEVDRYNERGLQREFQAHSKLTEVLARPEFSRAATQNAWDRLQQRAAAYVARVLGALLDRLQGHPIAARALFWILLLGAVAGLALLVFRLWSRRARAEIFKAPDGPIAPETYQAWIRDARLAADRNHFGEAIHNLYWAAVVYMEDSRVILRERSRTPRERIRQFPADDGIHTQGGESRRQLFQALTAGLERSWYAGIPASPEDFLEAIRLVEELGCRWQ